VEALEAPWRSSHSKVHILHARQSHGIEPTTNEIFRNMHELPTTTHAHKIEKWLFGMQAAEDQGAYSDKNISLNLAPCKLTEKH
jgi:hypothetical protein